MKILIIEDEVSLAEILGEKLKSENFEVNIATDGEAGLVAARQYRPDVILLDLILPKKHGLEVLADLKADEELKSIPVVVFSNLDSDLNIQNALGLGAADYLVKAQFTPQEIVEKIKKYQS